MSDLKKCFDVVGILNELIIAYPPPSPPPPTRRFADFSGCYKVRKIILFMQHGKYGRYKYLSHKTVYELQYVP